MQELSLVYPDRQKTKSFQMMWTKTKKQLLNDKLFYFDKERWSKPHLEDRLV
jgi:hypothetical protein